MFPFVLRKILSFFILLVFLVFFILLLQRSRQGSAALVLSGQQSSAKEIAMLEEITQNKLSLGAHFAYVLCRISRLDFGTTITGQPVYAAVFFAFTRTLALSLFAGAFALMYGSYPGNLRSL